ncbi:hypothetical protein NDU88_008994 [Pleurodeles waltl]|uniref:Uncharacterized protein n=1 Tax=Pleurodeles waltl TaxID=8319 RepID=A0AAV7QQD5_PLEWA|nr:hypothetical protein NDU88_008994 [Pleurodeles waltl]
MLPGAKWQPPALVPLKSLGLVVQAPPSNEKVRPAERVCSVLFTAPLGAKWQLVTLVQLRSLGLVVQAPLKQGETSSRGVGLQRPFHRASGRKMAASGSSATKESGACGSGSPQARRKLVPRSVFAMSFSPRLQAQNGSQLL